MDRSDGMPAYRQLVQQVREGLRLGWLRPGQRLPTVKEAVASSGINANTVLKAYRELEMAGLVQMRQGSGTFVTDALREPAAGTLVWHRIDVSLSILTDEDSTIGQFRASARAAEFAIKRALPCVGTVNIGTPRHAC